MMDQTVLPATHTFIRSILPNRRASPPFGKYSFPVRLKARKRHGWSRWPTTQCDGIPLQSNRI